MQQLQIRARGLNVGAAIMPIVADLGFGLKRAVGMASVTCRYHVGAQRSVCFGRVNQVLSDCSRGVKWGGQDGVDYEIREVGAAQADLSFVGGK